MEGTAVKATNHTMDCISRMTTSQMVFLGFLLLGAYAYLNEALKNGWTPDFDLKNGRVRFVHESDLACKALNEE